MHFLIRLSLCSLNGMLLTPTHFKFYNLTIYNCIVKLHWNYLSIKTDLRSSNSRYFLFRISKNDLVTPKTCAWILMRFYFVQITVPIYWLQPEESEYFLRTIDITRFLKYFQSGADAHLKIDKTRKKCAITHNFVALKIM